MSSGVPASLLEGVAPAERTVLAAVAAAGDGLRERQAVIAGRPDEVEWKDDGTAVTTADRWSERLIVEAIDRGAAGTPYRLVNEERTRIVDSDADVCWFVDPLDGTNAYRRGGDDYAVLVSRWAGTQPELSITHYPASGLWLVASGGSLHMSGSPPPVSRGTWCRCYMEPDAAQRAASAAGAASVLDTLEATEALLQLALGRVAAVAVQVWRLRAWDVAAGIHAVEASGGHVLDERGRRLSPRDAVLDARFVLAAADPDDLSRLVRCVGTGDG